MSPSKLLMQGGIAQIAIDQKHLSAKLRRSASPQQSEVRDLPSPGSALVMVIVRGKPLIGGELQRGTERAEGLR